MANALQLIAPRFADARRTTGLLASAGRKHHLLYPLDVTYARAGVDSPAARTVSRTAIPSPYRELLVHDRSMTATLERHFGVSVLLRSMFTWSRGRWYFRRVVLAREDNGHPIELGAVHINLDAVSRRIRTLILRHELPLGRILSEGPLPYRSRPRRFLAVTPNSEMLAVFSMAEPATLFGRQTELSLGGRVIGDVVEVLR
jgi:chorismate-pyruvate lyase